MNHRITRFILVALVVASAPILYSSCFYEDPEVIKPGIAIRASGHVYDNTYSRPLVNAKAYVVEFGFSDVSGFYILDNIDSAMTDANGHFDISFLTSGKGYRYELRFVSTSGFYNFSFYNDANVLTPGKQSTFELTANRITLLHTTLHIEEHDVPYFSGNVGNTNQFFVITKAAGDSTLDLHVYQNRKNVISFFYNDLDTVRFQNMRVDSVDLTGNFSDTLNYEFFLSPDDFPRVK